MPDRGYIDDWYKDRMERIEFDPGEDLWERIDSSLETDAVWNRLNDSLDIDDVWNRLDTSLDIDEVWHRLDASLDQGRRRVFYYRWVAGVAASLLLLVAIGAGFLWNPGGNNPADPSGIGAITEMRPFSGNELNLATGDGNDASVGEPAEKLVNPQQNQRSFADNPKNENTPSRMKHNPVPNGPAKIFFSENLLKGFEKTSPQEDSVGSRNAAPENLLDKQVKKLISMIQPKDPELSVKNDPYLKRLPDPTQLPEELKNAALADLEKDLKQKHQKNFFVGGTMGVKNQWLLSHDTYASFKSSELQSTSLDFSGTMGLNAGLMITERLGIQTDYVLLSQAGQKYNDFSNGRNVNRELDFAYQSLMVGTRINRKEMRIFNQPLVDHFNLGVYGGVLTEAVEQVSGKTTMNVQDAYKRYDAGLSVGYGLDMMTKSGVMAGFGLRLQQGLVNTYEGTTFLPSSLNPTYNTSVDFIFNLRYAFRKK